MKKNLIAALLLAFAPILASAQLQIPYDTLQKPKLISKQFKFTEGPAVDKKGNVFFTDQPNNRIWKYSTNGQLSVFMEPAGRSNGMFFNKQGNLISCADENGQLWSITPAGKVTVLLDGLNGLQFNGPNDCWVKRSNGDIYFTDPYYQRDYWQRKTSALDGEKVYYLAKGASKPVIADDKLKKPNGITGTPDGKQLYVADIGAGKTYRYNITADGSLTDKTVFCNQGSDGMTIDSQGNVYLTGRGVSIYNKEGQKIGQIKIDEPWTANVCFGGKDKKLLFITASTAIYTLEMNVKGVE